MMKWKNSIHSLFDGILKTIYPDTCHVCGRTLVRGEKVMCLYCMASMPMVRDNATKFNSVHKRLASTHPIERAAAMFHYHKGGPHTNLILKAKYNSQPYIAHHLGQVFARKLMLDGFFDGIDAIVPVPLHWWKKMRRGYNQSAIIAQGISSVTGLPVNENLIGAHSHSTQTRKGLFQRWKNARDSYFPRNTPDVETQHILIVDDVLTTGATILSVTAALRSVRPDLQISVLTLALTSQD